MRFKFWAFCLYIQFICLIAAQTPNEFKVKKFNFGLSTGIGGVHFILKPTLEIKMGTHNIAISAGLQRINFAYDKDFLFLRKKANKHTKYFSISGGIESYQSICIDICRTSASTSSEMMLLGYKIFSKKRQKFVSFKVGYLFYQTIIGPGNHGLTHAQRQNDFPKYENGSYPYGELKFGIYFLSNKKK